MVIFDELYDLISFYIFGGGFVSGSYPDLVCTLVATIGCLFLIALPFIIVWRAIKLFI